jgi:hypothetical protein
MVLREIEALAVCDAAACVSMVATVVWPASFFLTPKAVRAKRYGKASDNSQRRQAGRRKL